MNRFSLAISKEKLLDRFPGLKIKGKYIINYNIGASDPAYIISSDGKEIIQPAIWGMDPEGVFPSQKNQFLKLDYRNAHVSMSFRMPFRLNRCLILADGFYVWNETDRKPYFLSSKNKQILTFPGIYNKVRLSQDKYLMCFAVICNLNFKSALPSVFDFPLSLSSDDAESWISDLSVLEAVDLLKSSKKEEWLTSRVGNKVLIKGFNRPEVKKIMKPIPSLFS
jgi:putative SOS response-associated peptidase YedK